MRGSRSAIISPCGCYRYTLDEFWSGERALPIVMLNPSVADAERNDRTKDRCDFFARREGFGGNMLRNAYALRSTDPKALWLADDPVGPDNDRYLDDIAHWAARAGVPILCAWGANIKPTRQEAVVSGLRLYGARLVCLGRTKGGAPRHPLYIRGDQDFEDFS